MRSKLLMATAGVFVLLCTVVSYGQYGSDPTDRNFVAYKLTTAQEAQFDPTALAASPFWSKAVDCPSVDYVFVSPANNGVTTVFTGEDDAQLTVYTAYGANGLYFYFKVMDNMWVDYQVDCGGNPFGCTGDWANDAIDFALEPTTYASLTPTMFPLNNGWSQDCAQYQLRFGGAEAPTFFRFNYWNSTWDGVDASLAISWTGITFADAQSRYGIRNKIIPTTQSNVRVQEWLIPWHAVGNPEGTPVGAMPAVGASICAYYGYNDVDADATSQSGLKELRSGSGDQMNCAVRLPDGRLDSWSTVLFGPALDDQAASATPPCLQSSIRNQNMVSHSAFNGQYRADYYGVNGQRLTTRNGKLINHGLAIERKTYSNGAVVPMKVVK
jgi:hypothetical protein